jgi:hypothetical protein
VTPYRVFIAAEVVTTLRNYSPQERRLMAQLFEHLAKDPFRRGDYVESDEIGRPIQVLLLRRAAICFWADHAVREVKILDVKRLTK